MAELKNTDTVLIRDLALTMSIGVLESEKKTPQRVIVNISLSLSAPASTTDKIEDTICYAQIVSAVETLAKSQHFETVEYFAEQISKLCLDKAAAQNVKVRVEKPDILKECAAVGIEIFRIKP